MPQKARNFSVWLLKRYKNKMENLLNNKIVRIVFSIFIGIPVTAIILLASIYGLTFGLAGIPEGNLSMLSIGIINITGIIGAIGAWKRIYTTSIKMSEDEKNTTKAMLYSGVFSSLCLSVSAIYFSEIGAAFIFILLAFGSATFIYATPKNSNKTLQPDP